MSKQFDRTMRERFLRQQERRELDRRNAEAAGYAPPQPPPEVERSRMVDLYQAQQRQAMEYAARQAAEYAAALRSVMQAARGMQVMQVMQVHDEIIYESAPLMTYHNLSYRRRVVLDLAYSGYGPAAQIVEFGGELLSIEPPGRAQTVLVPGRVHREMHLGEAVAKLLAAEARFDLIVTDVHCGDTTPRIGYFTPPPKPLARKGRKLLSADDPPPEPVDETPLPMALAVWRATHALLSDDGEALLRMHIADFNRVATEVGVDKLDTLWWVDTEKTPVVDLYVAKSGRPSTPLPLQERMTPKTPKGVLTRRPHHLFTYAPQQRGKFVSALQCTHLPT